ncbi:gliding motility protein GldO [Dokdonia pacifica]|uniref:Protein involved in gliding motility GldN n=1 Tax=Dokdonia pacifica TaxID=1627892 RepID=A0A239DHZ3_9FLAO|nr:gliding motility protein GldN [Dokdonia pacifica]GGG36448.1 gliding motility protein GldO [Dokdonia pacifica]SNS31592.1 protein involved in gliding motility GldN [Dokdonia pacifica]
MNLKKLILVAFVFVMTTSVYAQGNILNAKTPDEMFESTEGQIANDNDEPLPYGYVEKRDVLWSKNTWEVVDLDERVNFPLYYPIDTVNIGSDRRSLYDVLMKNIKNGKIDAIYDDSYFTNKITLEDIQAALEVTRISDDGIREQNEGLEVSDYNRETIRITAQDINAYHVRGYWYVDKRQGELKYRLLGIAPVSTDVNFIGSDDEFGQENLELFWVWFPGAREILHKAKAFNRKNTSMPISFDHLLNSRRFNGIVYKEDNVQGDRQVKDYINNNAMMQLLESTRIKESIRNLEQDLWNY